ncbi:MAG: hypothetical protein WA160_11255 [Pseudobdellovibrio sp.]
MISVLLYSRGNKSITSIIADQLDILGYSTEETRIINLPRLILNPYQVIHFIIDTLPLTLNEFLCLTAAKALGKAVVVSVLNPKPSDKNLILSSKSNLTNWIYPDALTVSQTNHLKIFRDFTSLKMIFPALFDTKNLAPNKKKSDQSIGGFLFPLFSTLEEAVDFESEKIVYFDGRNLLSKYSSSHLRKKWTELIITKKIKSHYHLILSENKINALLQDGPLGIILSSPEMTPTDFALWLEKSLQKTHLIILNQFQATGFSSHWTSGHNCFVTSSHQWLKELNSNMNHLIFNQSFAIADINKTSLDSLFNELSRLYTKIIYQKTSLLDSDSAKIV